MRITELVGSGPATIRAGSDGSITICVPIALKRHSSHKRIIGTGEVSGAPKAPLKLTPFQLALVRGYRWLDMLESGEATSMKILAEREKVDPSIVSRLTNLTTLSPETVQAVLEDALPSGLTLLEVAIDPPLDWDAQRNTLVRA